MVLLSMVWNHSQVTNVRTVWNHPASSVPSSCSICCRRNPEEILCFQHEYLRIPPNSPYVVSSFLIFLLTQTQNDNFLNTNAPNVPSFACLSDVGWNAMAFGVPAAWRLLLPSLSEGQGRWTPSPAKEVGPWLRRWRSPNKRRPRSGVCCWRWTLKEENGPRWLLETWEVVDGGRIIYHISYHISLYRRWQLILCVYIYIILNW